MYCTVLVKCTVLYNTYYMYMYLLQYLFSVGLLLSSVDSHLVQVDESTCT